MSGTAEALCLTQPPSSLIFIARIYGDFSSWHWIPVLGVGEVHGVGLGSLAPQEEPPNSYRPHMGVGLACSVSSLLPILMQLLL